MTKNSATPIQARAVAWSEGGWRNPPASVTELPDGSLVAEAIEGSDAWQKTSYRFVRDSEHGLLRPYEQDSAVEVEFVADMSEQFDQAGLIVRADAEHWIKAGTEFADGILCLSTVVTDGFSDWSTAPVPAWQGKRVTVRASWAEGAISVRAKVEGEKIDLIRLAPWTPPPGAAVAAGPYLCAPSRSGFSARFTGWQIGPRDATLH